MLWPTALGNLPEQLKLPHLPSAETVALTHSADAGKQKYNMVNFHDLINVDFLKEVTSSSVSDAQNLGYPLKNV